MYVSGCVLAMSMNVKLKVGEEEEEKDGNILALGDWNSLDEYAYVSEFKVMEWWLAGNLTNGSGWERGVACGGAKEGGKCAGLKYLRWISLI